MTSHEVVLTTYAFTQSPSGVEQATRSIYGHDLIHVPADGLCWFYTILLGFLSMNSSFRAHFGVLIGGLHVPLFKTLLHHQNSFETFDDTPEFWKECRIIIEFLKLEILKYEDIIESSLIETFGKNGIDWKTSFRPGKHEGFFHSFRVVEIYISLIRQMPFSVQICSANLLGITEKYAVTFNQDSPCSFSVYLNNGHYWFMKNPLDFFPIALERDQSAQNSRQSMSNLIEHINHLEEMNDALHKELERLTNENSLLVSQKTDLENSNDILKRQLSTSDQLLAEELDRRS